MVAIKKYIPERGDLVWITFDPTVGHEQRGRRPGCVISSKVFNGASNLAFICPITSQIKGYPFEVPVSLGKTLSVILVDQMKSLDWSKRNVKKIERASPSVMRGVQTLLMKIVLVND